MARGLSRAVRDSCRRQRIVTASVVDDEATPTTFATMVAAFPSARP